MTIFTRIGPAGPRIGHCTRTHRIKLKNRTIDIVLGPAGPIRPGYTRIGRTKDYLLALETRGWFFHSLIHTLALGSARGDAAGETHDNLRIGCWSGRTKASLRIGQSECTRTHRQDTVSN